MKSRTLYNYDFVSDALKNGQSCLFTYSGAHFVCVRNIWDEFVIMKSNYGYDHTIMFRFPITLSLSTIRRRFGKSYAKAVISCVCGD